MKTINFKKEQQRVRRFRLKSALMGLTVSSIITSVGLFNSEPVSTTLGLLMAAFFLVSIYDNN